MGRSLGTLQRVASADGTPIAVHRSGRGRPLVLVHGTTATAARGQAIQPLLEDHVAPCAVDRRGRGASGDGELLRGQGHVAMVSAPELFTAAVLTFLA